MPRAMSLIHEREASVVFCTWYSVLMMNSVEFLQEEKNGRGGGRGEEEGYRCCLSRYISLKYLLIFCRTKLMIKNIKVKCSPVEEKKEGYRNTGQPDFTSFPV